MDNAIRILNNENIQDIVCIKIPKEINYADYMIIGTCQSEKHLNSAFLTLNQSYKYHKSNDSTVNNSYLRKKMGKQAKWSAIDTGKIVIHLFMPDYREFYDLESLWTCGSEFDERYNEFLRDRQELESKLTIFEVKEDEINVDNLNKK